MGASLMTGRIVASCVLAWLLIISALSLLAALYVITREES